MMIEFAFTCRGEAGVKGADMRPAKQTFMITLAFVPREIYHTLSKDRN